ncbi:hypothetical protein [Chryseobacterium taiwanense]|uniref:Uncharacterized protein n=1 Tax=Chryseobacterium taiwanense TaxID=363331 RepID=A0A0B4D9J7_9FLAO|nr:hypothetical protein [Chryseobacterium taiwanense]KIC63351.1 hypothetical protein RM51_06625 [Chryseobacterium taiwanense]
MKNFIVFFILLFSCTSSSQGKHVDLQIDLQGVFKNNYDIYMIFSNKNNFSVEIKKPCMYNTYVNIHKEGKELPIKIRVKADPACAYPASVLSVNDTLEFKFPMNIREFYDFKDGEKYVMNIEYYISSNHEFTQKIISDDYAFIWRD